MAKRRKRKPINLEKWFTIALVICGVILLYSSYMNFRTLNAYAQSERLDCTFYEAYYSYGGERADYVINVHEYETDFIISDIILGAFDRSGFVSSIQAGDKVTLFIEPGADETMKRVQVSQVVVSHRSYIDPGERDEQRDRNAQGLFLFGCFAFIGALINHIRT